MILQDKIIPFYYPFLGDILQLEVPEEKIATCSNCTLSRSKQSPFVNTKCCSYFPKLPNFLIGALLLDNEDSLSYGQEQIRLLIMRQNGITPYGIVASLPHYNRKKELDKIGFWSHKKEDLEAQLCPFLNEGNCSVWKYRENQCMTWFCSSVGGKAGKVFWKKVNLYLKMIETSLSQYAMQQLGWPPAMIKTKAVNTTSFKLDDELGNVNQENYAKLWGDWAGHEETFYIKCYEIIRNVDAPKFKQITGLESEILETAIRDTLKDFIKNVFPEKLIFNPDVVLKEADKGNTRLVLDDVEAEIPTLLIPLIRGFNGKRTTVEVFHLGYNILYKMNEIIDELIEKGILKKI